MCSQPSTGSPFFKSGFFFHLWLNGVSYSQKPQRLMTTLLASSKIKPTQIGHKSHGVYTRESHTGRTEQGSAAHPRVPKTFPKDGKKPSGEKRYLKMGINCVYRNRCCPWLPLTKLGHPSSCQSPGLSWKCTLPLPRLMCTPEGPAVLWVFLTLQNKTNDPQWPRKAVFQPRKFLRPECNSWWSSIEWQMSPESGLALFVGSAHRCLALAPKDRWGPPPQPRDQLFFSSVKSKLGNHRFLTQVYILQARTNIKT